MFQLADTGNPFWYFVFLIFLSNSTFHDYAFGFSNSVLLRLCLQSLIHGTLGVYFNFFQVEFVVIP